MNSLYFVVTYYINFITKKKNNSDQSKWISNDNAHATIDMHIYKVFSRKYYLVYDNQINLVSTTSTIYTYKSIKLPLLTIAITFEQRTTSLMDIGYSIFRRKKRYMYIIYIYACS